MAGRLAGCRAGLVALLVRAGTGGSLSVVLPASHEAGYRDPRPARLRLILQLAALTLFALRATAAPLTAPTYLDFAPAGTAAREGAVLVSPADAYDAARGHGWTQPPAAAFAGETAWATLRPPALCDGVGGAQFSLRLDLAPGRWTALVFLDDGFRDAHTVRLSVNGRAHAHNPREFGLEEEPAKPPINRYRVAQIAFESASGGPTTITFAHPDSGAAHGARLLALHLLPAPAADSERARWFLRQLDEVGRHGSRASLEALQFELGLHAQEPEFRAFGVYWQAQVALLAEAERWHRAAGWDWFSAQTRSSMFTRYKIALSLLDALVEHPDGDTFLLRPRALWLRARLLYWIEVEQHLKKDKEAFDRDIAELRRRHPRDELVAMYAGEKIPDRADPAGLTPLAGAPAWSAAQFEALQRLRRVAHYWIDERQVPNGELGGKPDDDVETLRWWPTLMFSGNRKVTEAFARLAEGVWFSRRVHLGYSREARDVEHSSEFVSDTIPLMAFLRRDAEWIGRLAWSHGHMRDLWTGRNAHGQLQFKSAWIGATEIISEPPRNRDLAMNTRATKAVRYYAALRNDPAVDALLLDWSRTWAAAAARTDKGKPAGLFPASLRFPDAAFNGDEPTWHQANMFWSYFNWRGDGMLYDQLLHAWTRSGDAALLAPMRATLALLASWTDPDKRAAAPVGSAGWAAARLWARADFWSVVAQWRLETGDASFDDFLRVHGTPFLRWRLSGDASHLAAGITAGMLDHLRYNTPMRTTEVLFTDRIHVARDVGNCDATDLVVAMLTGNHAPEAASPYYHVAWDGAPPEFTALVSAAGPREFAAEIFSHRKDNVPVAPRFFRLTPGRYRVTLRDAATGRTLFDREETITALPHVLRLEVPGGTRVNLSVSAVR